MSWHSRILDAEPFWARHAGPFLLLLSRPHLKKAGFHTSEWLTSNEDGPSAQDTAYALLTDPRDTIETISVWSEREQSFSMNYRRADVVTEASPT